MKIVAASSPRRKCGAKSQGSSSNTQAKLKLQISSQSRFDPLGFGWLESV
jgi:hypothetical protein